MIESTQYGFANPDAFLASVDTVRRSNDPESRIQQVEAQYPERVLRLLGHDTTPLELAHMIVALEEMAVGDAYHAKAVADNFASDHQIDGVMAYRSGLELAEEIGSGSDLKPPFMQARISSATKNERFLDFGGTDNWDDTDDAEGAVIDCLDDFYTRNPHVQDSDLFPGDYGMDNPNDLEED